MGNMCTKKNQDYSITLLLVGYSGSGKSEIFSKFCKEHRPDGPTNGIHVYEPKISVPRSTEENDMYDLGISIIELGGSVDLLDIWDYYYPEAMGVIFMIDATDTTKIEENKLLLKKLITHNYLRRKPFLILSNRRTYSSMNFIDVIDLANVFNIEALSNSTMTPCRLEEVDFETTNDHLLIGMRWLTERVIQQYKMIMRMCDLQIRIRDLTEEFTKFITIKRRKPFIYKSGKRHKKIRPNTC